MEPVSFAAVLAVGLALLFAFTNGFHDSAGQVATVISSRTLTPETALLLAAAADFTGAYFFGTGVAQTIGKGIVDPHLIGLSSEGLYVLLSALGAAIVWNLITWRVGLPSSSSHALIGGMLGAFIAAWGTEAVQWHNVKAIVAVMLVSPLIGFALTFAFTKLTFAVSEWLTPKAGLAFKGLQVLTLIAQSLAHGTNDGQKTMGVIAFALVLTGAQPPSPAGLPIPHWVVVSSALAMAVGIAAGGWRIIRLLGAGLFRVRVVHSFTAQASSSLVMALASAFGFPTSTTQVISSSVLGAGAAWRPKSVRWAVAMDMVTAWLVTIPGAGLISAALFRAFRLFLF